MQDQIRQALDDLVILSQTLSTHDQQRVLKTIERFRNIVEEDDHSIALYKVLFFETDERPMKSWLALLSISFGSECRLSCVLEVESTLMG